MTTLYADTETFNISDIRVGSYRYAETAEIMLLSYAVDDGPVNVWDITADADMPLDLVEPWMDPDVEVVFHGAQFDRTQMRISPSWRYGAPALERVRCTMAQALAHSLPGGLEKLCGVLGVPEELWKHQGKDLIKLFSKAHKRPAHKGVKLEPLNPGLWRATSRTHPEEWAAFVEYARFDVAAMREVHKRLPRWNYQGRELALWHLDQRVNDRGIAVDLDLVHAAIDAVKQEKAALADQAYEMTGGAVGSATQRDKLLAHILAEYGVELPDMTTDTLERRMQDPDLPVEVKNLLGVRLEASAASVSKYQALDRSVSSDGRVRGLLQFCGAQRTGRWAGRIFQPQNLFRPTMKPHEIEAAIEELKAHIAHLTQPSVMKAASNSVRGALVAPPGRKLCVADLSNIEGRGAAKLAGEQWKLKAFEAFDSGTGHDLYALAYAKSFRCTPEEVMHDKKHGSGMKRQIGKVQELMLQYQGGVGAFLTGAATYRIDLEALARVALPAMPKDTVEEAKDLWGWAQDKGQTYGLPEHIFVACDGIKRLWRAGHPAIVSYWAELEEAARRAILNVEGVEVPCRSVRMIRVGNWLRIILPSGRALCYPSPRVEENGKISYKGFNQYTRRWQRIGTYGGKLLENITQAYSRDVLAWNMPAIEDAKYDIVLSVHDELVTETPDSKDYSAERLAILMSTVPEWAKGLPLAAAGFECYRYRKD